MSEWVLAFLRAEGLGYLPADQPPERFCLDLDGFRSESSQDLRRAREQEITGENRDRVRPPGVRTLVTPADGCLVHHVVVVQRRQVRQFDRHGGRDDALVTLVAELGCEQHQGGAKPLPARVDEVPGCLTEQRLLIACRFGERLLDHGEPATTSAASAASESST